MLNYTLTRGALARRIDLKASRTGVFYALMTLALTQSGQRSYLTYTVIGDRARSLSELRAGTALEGMGAFETSSWTDHQSGAVHSRDSLSLRGVGLLTGREPEVSFIPGAENRPDSGHFLLEAGDNTARLRGVLIARGPLCASPAGTPYCTGRIDSGGHGVEVVGYGDVARHLASLQQGSSLLTFGAASTRSRWVPNGERTDNTRLILERIYRLGEPENPPLNSHELPGEPRLVREFSHGVTRNWSEPPKSLQF